MHHMIIHDQIKICPPRTAPNLLTCLILSVTPHTLWIECSLRTTLLYLIINLKLDNIRLKMAEIKAFLFVISSFLLNSFASAIIRESLFRSAKFRPEKGKDLDLNRRSRMFIYTKQHFNYLLPSEIGKNMLMSKLKLWRDFSSNFRFF